MKICPYCGSENRDDAPACYACGISLGTAPVPPSGSAAPSGGAEPTQPVHTRNYPPRSSAPQPSAPGPYDTQQIPYTPRDYVPPAYNAPGTYPPPDPYAAQNYPGQTQAMPPYQQGYPPAQVYVPAPPPPPAYQPKPSRIWPVLLLGLGALLLFACGFAFWTLSTATNTGAARLRANLATQAAGTFGGGITVPGMNPLPTDAGSGSGLPAEPTPWPTFTPAPQPTEAPAPTSTPVNADAAQPTADATQASVAEKLLSEGCKTALNNLDKLSGQITSQPTVVLDSTWRTNLNQAVADMKTNCGTLDAASPVPGLVNQAHQDLAQAQSEFDQAGKLFDQGVQNLDPGKLLEAGQHAQSAVKLLNSAMAELKKIGQ